MKNLFLLPYSFKKYGIILIILTILAMLAVKFFEIELNDDRKELVKQLAGAIMCLALFFLNFYKRKDEKDEFIIKRIHTLFLSFLVGINFLILNTILSLISADLTNNYSGSSVLFFLLLFNLSQNIGIFKKYNVEKKNENELNKNQENM